MLVLFLLLVVLVLVRGRRRRPTTRLDARAKRARPDASELAEHPLARAVRLDAASCSCSSLGLGVAELIDEPSRATSSTPSVLIFMIVAVSATVLTGWAGQLSLGQFAFVAVGAYLTSYYAQQLELPASRS